MLIEKEVAEALIVAEREIGEVEVAEVEIGEVEGNEGGTSEMEEVEC